MIRDKHVFVLTVLNTLGIVVCSGKSSVLDSFVGLYSEAYDLRPFAVPAICPSICRRQDHQHRCLVIPPVTSGAEVARSSLSSVG